MSLIKKIIKEILPEVKFNEDEKRYEIKSNMLGAQIAETTYGIISYFKCYKKLKRNGI